MSLAEDARREVAAALARLIERAGTEVPEEGQFEPIVERCHIVHPHYPVDVVTLRIGPAQGEGERRRFLDVRVATKGEGSDSSTWVHLATKGNLLALLRNETTGLDAVVSAIEGSIESLHRFELK